MSHDDNVRHLSKKFDKARYANFGPLLQTVEIRGFRGVAKLSLDLRSPITALSGLNGTGKSTIAQLVACAYTKARTAALPRYYVRDFFPVSAADPAPFTSDCQIVYSYCVERGADPQQVTVSRKVKEWSGYKRQPERSCYYIGFTQFIPKVERRDFSIYSGRLVTLGATRSLSDVASAGVSQILALPYERLEFTEVTHSKRTTELAMATRGGRTYSENNMGFGEGRVVYMVNTMESAPAQSLFVLEEPETSLHGDAQRRLARYLVEVAGRRGHQIVLTTHSSAILSELGQESKMYLHREPTGDLTPLPGLSTYQIDSYLTQNLTGGARPTVCVEDDFARHLATEIVRRHDPHLLAGCSFLPTGSGYEMPKAVALLKTAGMKVVGLSDGDMKHDGSDLVLSLPGEQPPEREVLMAEPVKEHFAKEYGVSLAEIEAAAGDHHNWTTEIARRLIVDPSVVATSACRAYAASLPPTEVQRIVDFLKLHFGDRR